MELPIEEVRRVLKPRRRKKPAIQAAKVIKIREEYDIMLAAGYKKKYIREELSQWHGVKPDVIQRIVTGITYKNIKTKKIKQ